MNGGTLDRTEAREPVAAAETGVEHIWHKTADTAV